MEEMFGNAVYVREMDRLMKRHEVKRQPANTFFIPVSRPDASLSITADGWASNVTTRVSSLLKCSLIPFLGQLRHILMVLWKIFIALKKQKHESHPWRKSSSSAFTLRSEELSTICPLFFSSTLPTGRPDPAAFAKTTSTALTSGQIITAQHTSIMVLSSQRGFNGPAGPLGSFMSQSRLH